MNVAERPPWKPSSKDAQVPSQHRGLPWWPSGYDSALPRPGARGSVPGQGTEIPYAMRHNQKHIFLKSQYLHETYTHILSIICRLPVTFNVM